MRPIRTIREGIRQEIAALEVELSMLSLEYHRLDVVMESLKESIANLRAMEPK